MLFEGTRRVMFKSGVASWIRAALDLPIETRREFIDTIHDLMDDKTDLVGKFSEQVFRNQIPFAMDSKTKQLSVATIHLCTPQDVE